MSLYDTLGLAPDATAGQIRQAYRNLAQKNHPDKEGGDHELMQQIQKAYEVLGDPERRHQYDTEGTTGQAPTAREKALAMIGGTFNALIDQMSDEIDFKDPVQALRDWLHESLKEGETLQQDLAKRIQTRHKVLRRAKFRGADTSVLALLVNGQVKNLEGKMAEVEDKIQTVRDSLDLLVDYDYEVDQKPQLTPADITLGDLIEVLNGGATAKSFWPKFTSGSKP